MQNPEPSSKSKTVPQGKQMWKGRFVKRLWYWNVKIANSMLGEFIVKYQNLALRILYYYIILIISAKFI